MKTEISYRGLETASPLGLRVRNALRRAIEGQSKVTPELLSILGMSGKLYRMFINNLVESTPDARYLEVGSWAGSTLCSAIYGNKVRALAIDNWSQFDGPQHLFFSHLSAFVGKESAVSFFNSDFRAVPYGALGKFNIYLFDGPHEYQDQYDGLALAKDALDDEIVFIVDDWNWPGVRAGTHDAIRDAGWKLAYSVEIRSTDNDRHPGDQGLPQGPDSDWHNGYFIGVLRR
jgi:hypothetical protein